MNFVQQILESNRQQATQMAEMTRKLTEAVAANQKPQGPTAPPGALPDDEQVFGKDVLNLLDRRLGGVVQQVEQMYREIMGHIEQLRNGVKTASTTAEYTVEQQFVMALSSAVPSWRTVNVEPGFIAWLKEEEGFTGQSRKQLLDAAAGAFDSARVARIFQAYISTKTPAPAAPQPQNDLAAQVAPNTSAAAPAPVAPEAPSFSSAQVQSFYDDVIRGKYRGREAEANRISAAIDAAAAAGRITL
jgi:hypothetical protein